MASDQGESIMYERTYSLWLVFVVVGLAFPLSCGAGQDVGDSEGMEPVPIEKQELKDDVDPDAHALRAEAAHFRYDKKCKLLALVVKLKNVSEQPIFLVAEDFAFVRRVPGRSGHQLGVEQKPGALTLDLSYLKPTAAGAEFFLGEWGSLGPAPTVMEMRPHSFRYTTYVFQFPMRLNDLYSDTWTVAEPKGPTKVTLRFGYALEHFEDFSEKNRPSPGDTVETRSEMIMKEWQKVILTKPVSVDFP